MPYQVMVTGSRKLVTESSIERDKVYAATEKMMARIVEEHPEGVVFLIGMAEGFDECCATICWRNNYRFIACLPNDGYGNYYWRRNSLLGRDRLGQFQFLLSQAEEVIYVCESIYEDGKHSNFIRNDYMVDHSDYALVYGKNTRGTKHAYHKILGSNKDHAVYPYVKQLELFA